MALAGWGFYTDATFSNLPGGFNGAGNAWLNELLVTNGGWTRIFHNAGTNESVFQMPGGSGRVLYVRHDSSASGAAQRMIVRGAASASGYAYADLVDPFPTTAQVADTSSNWLISTAASLTTRAFRAQVWESGFVFNIEVDGGGSWQGSTFQDADPADPTDTFSTLVATRNTTSNSSSSCAYTTQNVDTDISLSTSPGLYWCRSIDGLAVSTRGCIFGGTSIGGLSGAPTLDSGYLGTPRHEVLWASCNGSTTTSSSPAGLVKRARIIGVRNPLHGGIGSLTAADFVNGTGYVPGAILRPMWTGTGTTSPGWLCHETNDWSPN